MSQERSRSTDIWNTWSYSKLTTLYTCPLQFWFQYVLSLRAPTATMLAVGSALHFMAYRFFSVRYKSAESFASEWKHFWNGVVQSEHGPSSYDPRISRPVSIAWENGNQSGYWFHKGGEMLAGFYGRHIQHREPSANGVVIGAKAEHSFRRLAWRCYSLSGQIDRIDEYPDHVEIIDYKMGAEADIMVQGSLQPIFYQLAYELVLKNERFHGKPLRSIRIENLISGKEQEAGLATAAQIDTFNGYLAEASTFVRAILERRQPHLIEAPLTTLHPRGVADGIFYPRLPRGNHCKNCIFMVQCRDWEQKQPTPARDVWLEELWQRYLRESSDQPQLKFEK
ncbi:MAG: PD-(D/E)XK nuclease family protein [Patescibacteria group bacterium]